MVYKQESATANPPPSTTTNPLLTTSLDQIQATINPTITMKVIALALTLFAAAGSVSAQVE